MTPLQSSQPSQSSTSITDTSLDRGRQQGDALPGPTESTLTTPAPALSVRPVQDLVLDWLLAADAALCQAVEIDQVALVLEVVEAHDVFAQRLKLGEDVFSRTHAIEIRALARLGELVLEDTQKAGGARWPKIFPDSDFFSNSENPEILERAKRLARLPLERREAVAQGKETLREAMDKAYVDETRRQVGLPDAKYRVIYAAPWSYPDEADAEPHNMRMGRLFELPVEAIAEDDAVLFLRAPSPLLPNALEVVREWGFTYNASSVHQELMLIGTRGSCTLDLELVNSVHGTTPEAFRRIIEALCPIGKRVELFAWAAVDGWDVWQPSD